MGNEETENAHQDYWDGQEMKVWNRPQPKHSKHPTQTHGPNFSKEKNKISNTVYGCHPKCIAGYYFKCLLSRSAEVGSTDCDDSVSILVEELEDLLETPEAADAALEAAPCASIFLSFAFGFDVHQDVPNDLHNGDYQSPKGNRTHMVQNEQRD